MAKLNNLPVTGELHFKHVSNKQFLTGYLTFENSMHAFAVALADRVVLPFRGIANINGRRQEVETDVFIQRVNGNVALVVSSGTYLEV